MKDIIGLKPEMLVIGSTKDSGKKVALESVATGPAKFHDVETPRRFIREMKLQAIKKDYPAEFEVCTRMLAQDENCKYPKGVGKKIHRAFASMRITFEQPVEFYYEKGSIQ